MNRCAGAHVATSPAPDRRRGRYCRSAILRTREGLARWPALVRVSQGPISCESPSSHLTLVRSNGEPDRRSVEALPPGRTSRTCPAIAARYAPEPRVPVEPQACAGLLDYPIDS